MYVHKLVCVRANAIADLVRANMEILTNTNRTTTTAVTMDSTAATLSMQTTTYSETVVCVRTSL